MNDKIEVLDKGYVRLVDYMGSDLTPANAARVSFNKQTDKLTKRDEGLIRFLAEHDHTSPFRHAMLQFEVYAPLMTARQWWKYIVGQSHQDPATAWNESSRRYVTEVPEFYIPGPNEWRSRPENAKQGSGAPLPTAEGLAWTQALMKYAEEGEQLYEAAQESGICTEQARLFLPAYGLYVRWYWTASLYGVAHLLNQRLSHDAQKEFQEYASAVHALAQPLFPVSLSVLVDYERAVASQH